MLHDEMNHCKAHGQFIFQNEIELDAAIEGRLREWLKDANNRSAGTKTLNPKDVASARADFAKTYTFYSQLSSDAAHPSVDALNRYVVPHTENEVDGIDVEPVVKDAEIAETLEYLCMAFIGVCVGVNQMLGGTPGGNALIVCNAPDAIVLSGCARCNCLLEYGCRANSTFILMGRNWRGMFVYICPYPLLSANYPQHCPQPALDNSVKNATPGPEVGRINFETNLN
jgi:hypothetical protein